MFFAGIIVVGQFPRLYVCNIEMRHHVMLRKIHSQELIIKKV
jgi:hypothetical protein